MKQFRSWMAALTLCTGLAGSLVATGRAAAQATADALPVIERVEPTSGPPGTVVHVIGRRFGKAAKVQLGAQPLELVDSLPNRLSVRIPEGAQSEHLAVTNAAGTVRGTEFRVTAKPPAPKVDALEPAKGPPGSNVVLRGQHFSPRLTGNVVTLAGQPVIVSAATPVELHVIVPEVERSGPFVVRVEQAGETSSAPFEVTAATRIEKVEPPRAGPGAQLTIRGRGFSKTIANNRVYLNNARLTVKSASETELVVQLPVNAASGKLLVDVQGAGRAHSADPFTVQRPPTVTEFAPKSGIPGTLVTVRGTNFGVVPAVVQAAIDGKPLEVHAARDTKLELLIPEGTPSGKLSIRVNGVGPVWSNESFAVLQALKIASFAPQTGPAGTEVVIEGQGFAAAPGQNRVTIGGQLAPVLEADPKRLKVRVPKAPSGPIQVQVQGSGEVRTTAPFVVTVPPKVTSVTPLEGPVGTELRIEGEGFGSNPAVLKVLLGNHPLAVQSLRDDVAVVRVTLGSKSGRLKVAVPLQGSDQLDAEFKVLPPPVAPAPAPVPAPAP